MKYLIQPNPETKILSLTTLTLDTTFMIMNTLSLYKDSHFQLLIHPMLSLRFLEIDGFTTLLYDYIEHSLINQNLTNASKTTELTEPILARFPGVY